MAEVTMPRLSDTMEEGTIARWLKNEGDKIQRGDELLEIETDKATMTQESYDEGVLEKILVKSGQTVPIGTAIAVIGDGSSKPAASPAAAAAPAATTPAPAAPAAPTPAPAYGAAAPASAPQVAAPTPVAITGDGGRVLASPMAKRIASEFGIALETIQGSGPGGRIVKDDVLAITRGAPPAPAAQPVAAAPAPVVPAPTPVASPPAQPAPVAAAAAPSAAPAGADYEDIELNRMRQTIARRMTEAKQQVPHIYLTIEINMSEALKWRPESFNQRYDRKSGG